MDIWPGKGDKEERIRVPTFTTTPYGIRARIPVVTYTNFSVALLFCTHKNTPVGIALTRCPDAADEDRPLYHCNAQSLRLVSFPPSQQVGFVVQWETMYLAAQPGPPSARTSRRWAGRVHPGWRTRTSRRRRRSASPPLR